MTAYNLLSFIDLLKKRAYSLEKRKKHPVQINVDFVFDNISKRRITNGDRNCLTQLAQMILYDKPDSIDVFLKNNETQAQYSYSLLENGEKHEKSQKSKHKKIDFFAKNEFSGFGEAEIENIVNKRLEEERKIREISELKNEILRKNDEISQLLTEKNEILQKNAEKNEKIEKLENELESKKTIRYYAGLAGDILESIGINKSQLRQPLAGIIAQDNQSHKELPPNTTSLDDESGIVEHSQDENQTKRNEIIMLIKEYLHTTDDDTLANIFMIFSEIEQDKSLSSKLMNLIENNKTNKHANI